MDNTLPDWVADAARLPLAFAQVREDPLLDAQVVESLAPGASIIMIASGGCTLAYLAARCRVARIDVVDPNPAQIALSRLKLHLLQNVDSNARLALLGHAFMPATERQDRLLAVLRILQLPADVLGPPHVWAKDGPDYAGRYERVFLQLRQSLLPHDAEILQLLSLEDPREQAQRVSPDTPLGRALDDSFDQAMDLAILVRLFGEGATRNRVEPFARHFARRTRHVLATLPAARNPYLWQVLAGCYPPGAAVPWLIEPDASRSAAWPEITWTTAFMTEALRRRAGYYDFVHLSNILDWLSPEEAGMTLELARTALRPGGLVLIRQLNSTLDIPGLDTGFSWQTDEAQSLHDVDRSYFYRTLHLGRKT